MKKNGLFKAGAAVLCICLAAGGAAGWYFGSYTKDFKVTKGDVFSEVYPGDFYEAFPYDNYLSVGAVPTAQNIFDIREYGASPDSRNNRDAVQTALDKAAQNGGVVLVSGGRYVTGSLKMGGNTTLFIEKDAALVASHEQSDMNLGCLLFCEDAENITLTGGGAICGEGNFYSLAPKYAPKTEPFEDTLGVWEMRQEYRKRIRFAAENKYGNLVRLVRCNTVTIENFMLQNSAAWSLELNGCDGVQIRDFVIDNNRHVANTDGIDVAGSSNVKITHCFVSTGDDGIVLKNSKSLGRQAAMKNITVRDCKVSSCTNAFKIGTETSFDVQNVLVENCEFFLEDIYPGGVSGISLESADGAKVQNVTVRNIQMRGEACPLFISLNNRNRDKDFDLTGALENITVENVTAEDAEIPVIITGTKDLTVRNVTLRNFQVRYAAGKDYYDYRPFVPAYADTYPECNRMRNLNAYGLFARYADGVKLENFTVVPREDTKRDGIRLTEVEHFEQN